jgi:hypothetical protein
MKLPRSVRSRFQRYGRQGGMARAARLSPRARQAVARRAASARWIRQRFGAATFEVLGLPGGRTVDQGLADLAEGRVSPEALLVSLSAPRLRREGVPVGAVLRKPEERLYRMLCRTEGDLAHARYKAWLRLAVSFADSCWLARRSKERRAR